MKGLSNKEHPLNRMYEFNSNIALVAERHLLLWHMNRCCLYFLLRLLIYLKLHYPKIDRHRLVVWLEALMSTKLSHSIQLISLLKHSGNNLQMSTLMELAEEAELELLVSR